MAVLYTNNAVSTLAASITSTATSFSVASGNGALFPVLSGADYFYATLYNTAGTIEIVKVTARSVDTFTVARAQDGTTGTAYSAGDKVELRLVRAALDDIKTDTKGSLSSGNVTSALGFTPYNATNPSGYTANTGTVTSVGGTGTVSGITLSGTVTTSGNLTLGGTLSVTPSNFASQTANTFLAAPNGAAGTPTFRAVVAADIPTLNQSTTGNAATATTATNQSGGTVSATTGAFSGKITASSGATGAGTSSSLYVSGDITTARTSTTGVIYLGTSGSNYLYYDGANYAMPGGQLDVNGSRVLTAANYTSYAPSTTGSGASGTWAINVSGSSASTSGNAATSTTLIGDSSNWASYRSSAVANMLGWKNYGNNHVIFDASNSTAPNGTAVNNTNSQVVWTATYPTLMGWNGTNTYGVRVDSARISDNTSGNAATATTAGTAGTVTMSAARTDATAYPVVWGTSGSTSQMYSCSAVTIQSSTGTLSATTFSGAGTSLTGTAASLSIGGSSGSLSGYGNPATGATGNTIAYRDGNGDTNFRYANASYFNQSSSNAENGTISQVMITNGTDNYLRKASISAFTSSVQSNASGSWGISITGSAASATTATTATSATTATYGASGTAGSSGAVHENTQTITSNYTMTTSYNGVSAGPITINTGITVTIPTGSSWSIV